MSAHIHADLMKQYYEDALETDKPWERWERQTDGSNTWTDCTCSPNWTPTTQYRRKRVPLCQVEGRDVFQGDELWHKHWKCVVIAKNTSQSKSHLICAVTYDDSTMTQTLQIQHLTWNKPPKTKTVYQWAFKYHDGWFMTEGFFETAEQAKHNSGDSSMDFRRLDYTALEVPA